MSADGRKKSDATVPIRDPSRPILGIDPGLQRTGYAFLTSDQPREIPRIIEAGVIRLNPKQPLEHRLVELERNLEQLITLHCPAVMAVEQLYAHYKHPRTAIIMGHARGVILALAARAGLSVIHVAATHVKKHLTGSGHAGKAQVQRAVAATLRLPCIPEPNDVADALAVAFCALQIDVGWAPPTAGTADPRVGRSPLSSASSEPEASASDSARDPASQVPHPATSTAGRRRIGGQTDRAESPLPPPKLPPNISRSPNSKPRPAASTAAAADGDRI